MAGVRLHHPTLAGVTYVVELPSNYPQPYDCPSCHLQHARKSLHLRLDAAGDVIVSQEVLTALRQVFLAGMEVSNEVPAPPAQYVGAVEQPKYETQMQSLNGHAQRFWLPGRTRYESRDRIWQPFQPLLLARAERQDRIATAKARRKRRRFIFGRSR